MPTAKIKPKSIIKPDKTPFVTPPNLEYSFVTDNYDEEMQPKPIKCLSKGPTKVSGHVQFEETLAVEVDMEDGPSIVNLQKLEVDTDEGVGVKVTNEKRDRDWLSYRLT